MKTPMLRDKPNRVKTPSRAVMPRPRSKIIAAGATTPNGTMPRMKNDRDRIIATIETNSCIGPVTAHCKRGRITPSIFAKIGRTFDWTFDNLSAGIFTRRITLGIHGVLRRNKSCTAKTMTMTPKAGGIPGSIPSGVIIQSPHNTIIGPNDRFPNASTTVFKSTDSDPSKTVST